MNLNLNRRLMKLSPTRVLLGGYCLIILIGAVLLTLPAASKSGEFTSFTDAFFTAASATCVTGLVRFDTFSYWSLFGQIVILLLIQIGGMGFMTITIFLACFTGKKIGLTPRFLMQESVSAPQVGGIVRMTRFILLGTLPSSLEAPSFWRSGSARSWGWAAAFTMRFFTPFRLSAMPVLICLGFRGSFLP